jgi:hypothetical protein
MQSMMPVQAFMLVPQPLYPSIVLNPLSIPTTTTQIRQQPQPQYSIELQMQLDDEKIVALFAWIHQAFQGDLRYNNLLLAMATIFGTNFPESSEPMRLYRYAMQHAPDEEARVGEAYTRQERERASLGAMGAGQWTGQWKTRPHALLSVQNYTCVQDWIQTLPRGCQRTLNKKALPFEGTNFTVTAIPIPHRASAPHATLAHFRCVVEHEVRLLASVPSYLNADDDDEDGMDVSSFFDALSEAVGRYLGTTRMAGEIREYRDVETGRVIAFAHEVIKGRTIRGQWFYATDRAAQSYVWFHSVRSLVERAIQNPNVDVVDLGPSGSDNFSALKARYGFQSVDDWPRYADYQGPFWDYVTQSYARGGIQY